MTVTPILFYQYFNSAFWYDWWYNNVTLYMSSSDVRSKRIINNTDRFIELVITPITSSFIRSILISICLRIASKSFPLLISSQSHASSGEPKLVLYTGKIILFNVLQKLCIHFKQYTNTLILKTNELSLLFYCHFLKLFSSSRFITHRPFYRSSACAYHGLRCGYRYSSN